MCSNSQPNGLFGCLPSAGSSLDRLLVLQLFQWVPSEYVHKPLKPLKLCVCHPQLKIVEAVLFLQVQPQDIHPAAGRFLFGQVLGKGQSSQVVEVTDVSTGRRDLVAKISSKSSHGLLQEAMVLKGLQASGTFPDFIGMFTADHPDTRFLVLQRFYGSLEDLQRDGDGHISAYTVGIQVLLQLEVMHQMNLAHGDLKAKNMAVASIKPLRIL